MKTDAPASSDDAPRGFLRRNSSADFEEFIASASHYVEKFGRHDAYAGGEQVRDDGARDARAERARSMGRAGDRCDARAVGCEVRVD